MVTRRADNIPDGWLGKHIQFTHKHCTFDGTLLAHIPMPWGKHIRISLNKGWSDTEDMAVKVAADTPITRT